MTVNDFRRIALSFEGAEESSHMGNPDFRVGGRIFATLSSAKQGYGNLQLTLEQQAAFVEEMPEVYTQEELDAFFKACDSTESLIFSVFLKVGLRERELIHLEWSDLNFKESTLRVSAKPALVL